MAFKGLYAGTHADVPQLARLINGARQAVLAGEIELAARQLALMTLQRVNTCTRHDVPNLRRVVE